LEKRAAESQIPRDAEQGRGNTSEKKIIIVSVLGESKLGSPRSDRGKRKEKVNQRHQRSGKPESRKRNHPRRMRADKEEGQYRLPINSCKKKQGKIGSNQGRCGLGKRKQQNTTFLSQNGSRGFEKGKTNE